MAELKISHDITRTNSATKIVMSFTGSIIRLKKVFELQNNNVCRK